jgi:hypothetical protein
MGGRYDARELKPVKCYNINSQSRTLHGGWEDFLLLKIPLDGINFAPELTGISKPLPNPQPTA